MTHVHPHAHTHTHTHTHTLTHTHMHTCTHNDNLTIDVCMLLKIHSLWVLGLIADSTMCITLNFDYNCHT